MGCVIVLCDGFAVCRSAHGLGSSVQGAGDLGCSDSVLDVSDHVALDDQVPVEPFLELYQTKKFWVVGSQMLSGVLFGAAALSLQLPLFFAVSVAIFAVVAFSGATHDIAADGVYMSELSPESQAKYIGWQGAFYNLAKLAKLVATGGLVWLAGWLYDGFSAVGASSYDASVRSWTVVLLLLCGTLVALGLYHLRALPSGGSAAGGPVGPA